MRFRVRDITPQRVAEAMVRRTVDFPDRFRWKYARHANVNKRRLERFRNRHVGERCVIIANGPSLSKMDLSCLKQEITISMNRAYLLYEKWGFDPSYYVCINELVIEQFVADIVRLEMPVFLNFNRANMIRNMRDDDDCMYLKISLGINDKFQGDLTKAISSGGTVTFASLQLAYFMGFREVVLIGLDHNFVEKGRPNKTEWRVMDRDENHCHPEYFPKGTKWQLPDLVRSEMAYKIARKEYEKHGRRIYDATIGGKCQVFEKADFAEIFSR